jgi:hypothetical protein
LSIQISVFFIFFYFILVYTGFILFFIFRFPCRRRNAFRSKTPAPYPIHARNQNTAIGPLSARPLDNAKTAADRTGIRTQPRSGLYPAFLSPSACHPAPYKKFPVLSVVTPGNRSDIPVKPGTPEPLNS